jgi:hypothetical protein
MDIKHSRFPPSMSCSVVNLFTIISLYTNYVNESILDKVFMPCLAFAFVRLIKAMLYMGLQPASPAAFGAYIVYWLGDVLL